MTEQKTSHSCTCDQTRKGAHNPATACACSPNCNCGAACACTPQKNCKSA